MSIFLCETSPQHPLGTPCSGEASPPSCSWAPCHPAPSIPPPQAGGEGNTTPFQGWGLAVLGFAGGSSAAGVPLWCPLAVPLSQKLQLGWERGPLMVVAAPQKGFPTGSVMRPLLTPSHCGVCVCPLLWGHPWGGEPVWGSPVWAPERDSGVLGNAGDDGSVYRRCRGWRASS